jgi:TPR repeat protein
MKKYITILVLLLSVNGAGINTAWGGSAEDALVALSGDNYPLALALARPAAEKGSIIAQYVMAQLYNTEGSGVKYSKREADARFSRLLLSGKPAADKGSPQAQYVLCRLYCIGLGVEVDEKVGSDWCRKSADQGYAPAQYTLGINYRYGLGLPKDKVEAVAWWRKAENQGYPPAMHYLGFSYTNGEGVEADVPAGAAWWRKAAEKGYAPSQFRLGRVYGLAQDWEQATLWYRKAAAQGYAQAYTFMALNYNLGNGGPADPKKAVENFEIAAGKGDMDAQFFLAGMYGSGRGTTKNHLKALTFYAKAAKQGDERAIDSVNLVRVILGINKNWGRSLADWHKELGITGCYQMILDGRIDLAHACPLPTGSDVLFETKGTEVILFAWYPFGKFGLPGDSASLEDGLQVMEVIKALYGAPTKVEKISNPTVSQYDQAYNRVVESTTLYDTKIQAVWNDGITRINYTLMSGESNHVSATVEVDFVNISAEKKQEEPKKASEVQG